MVNYSIKYADIEKEDVMTDFEKTVDIIHRALDASVVRRNVIANNIANAEVPNFKRSDVNFESELKRALETEKQKPVLELALTDPKHISNWKERDYREVQPRRVLDYVSQSKNNGNNVDAEQEVMRALENQMLYTLLAQAETFEFGQVNQVLRG
jgi:flagellar basal-body rod protein FlgB